MSAFDVVRMRMANERLIGTPWKTPVEVVHSLGAMQAQDYAGARWAIGQRLKGATDADVERAYDTGAILRVHAMRPTWHFVAPADLRWLQALTAPRVRQVSAYYERQHGIDAKTTNKANDVIARALSGGTHLTREELADKLAAAKITASGPRLGHLMMNAELAALICSGPRRGKQFTYALVDERVPATPARDRDDALGELVTRYFTSHGPALVPDFAWWSGLTVADTKRGIAIAKLSSREHDGKTYWFAPSRRPTTYKAPLVHLLPNYDELLIAYKDHSGTLDPDIRASLSTRTVVFSHHLILLDGKLVGGWRRLQDRSGVAVETRLLRKLSRAETGALEAATARLGTFLGVSARTCTAP